MTTTSSNDKKIAFQSFFWNSVYAGLSATQAAIILFFAARALTLKDSGIITIGFTIANLMMVLAIYGMRNYQVTDVLEQNSFSDYFFCRIFTVGGTFFVACLFLVLMTVLGKYSLYKSLIVLEIIAMKMVDAFESVFVGRFQQKGFLNIGAKISSIRLGLAIATVCVSIFVFKSAWIAFLIGFAVSVVLDIFLIISMKKYADLTITPSTDTKPAVKNLLKIGITLCVGTTLLNYVGNAPKYLVDLFLLDDEIQAKVGYVMLPMFVITLLNNFIMQPTVKTLGDVWVSGDIKKLKKMIMKHITIIGILSVLVLIFGIFVGLPLIEALYKINLSEYRNVFCMLFIGGTFYTLSAYFSVLLTTVRKQRVIVIGSIVSILIYLVLGKPALESLGIYGLGVLYIVANVIILAVFIIGLIKNKKEDTKC